MSDQHTTAQRAHVAALVIVADGRNAWRVRIALALCDAHGCACELREIGESQHPSFVAYGPPRAVALVDDLASAIGLEISRASSVLRRRCPGEGGEASGDDASPEASQSGSSRRPRSSMMHA